ncbi:MAG: DUF1559 domain-containing protein, partial [Planctomycetaceae bacterium]|nr:DUF1559 domain-containing protein [Planctomycetaceae bacterium]
RDVEGMQPISYAVSLYVQDKDNKDNMLPNYAIFDANGTPLLSWRVALLPYLGEKELYSQFHLNEPWDSEHNKTLLDKMPKVFADPNAKAEPNKTLYRFFGGEGSLLGAHPGGLKSTDVAHPNDSILMIAVTPENAVEWTKPEFVQFDPKTFANLVSPMFAALFMSGEPMALPTQPLMAQGQMAYWVAGQLSPQAEALQKQQDEQFRQYMQQIKPSNLPQQPEGLVPPAAQPNGAADGVTPGQTGDSSASVLPADPLGGLPPQTPPVATPPVATP